MVVGDLIGSRYRVTAEIAAGGMGRLYEAHDERLDRVVALKILQSNLAADQRFVERFRREARAAGGLSHPNIATIYDYGESDGDAFIAMEHVAGRDLARVLREEGPLPPTRVAEIGQQVCGALDHAHRSGIVHRDVKPANIMIRDDGMVKVTDFGIARTTGDSTLTATGSVLGTAQYISPEQAEGRPATPASDIYSLGIVLYEMTTGSLPFTGDSAVAVAMRHVREDVPAPSDIAAGVPPELDAAVARATLKDPRRRPTAGELRAELGAPTTDPIDSPATAVLAAVDGRRVDRRSIGKWLLAAGAIILVVAAVAVGAELARDDTTSRRGDRTRRRQPAAATTAPQAIVIPEEIIGADEKTAREFLESLGLVVTPLTVAHEEPKDVVVGSDPAPGSTVFPGDPITLHVSDGEGDEDEDEDEEDHVPPGLEKKDKD